MGVLKNITPYANIYEANDFFAFWFALSLDYFPLDFDLSLGTDTLGTPVLLLPLEF